MTLLTSILGSDASGLSPDLGTPDPGTSGPGTSGPVTNVASGEGWNQNVSVFASSKSTEASVGAYSGGKMTDGYIPALTKGMNQNMTLTQAHDSTRSDEFLKKQAPIRNNANLNSLVPGGGGTAIVVTGDNIDPDGVETQMLVDSIEKNYGMKVKLIKDSSPDQLKAAMQEAGQQKGKQCLVAILAHGAKDTSGENKGFMGLGQGGQVEEADLKSWVNQYLSPSYANVNVIISSCYAGNFVQ